MNATVRQATSACPPEERLYAVLAAEGTADETAHVAACGACQAALRRLQEESTVLQQPLSAVAFAAAQTAAQAPGAIGKYIIVGRWDDAPGWTTYRGLHAVVHREVLVQVARQPLEGDSAPAALTAASRRWMTKQPHVAAVLDAGVFEQRPFLVVEYNGGVRLDRLGLGERTPELAAAFGPVADALAAQGDLPHLLLRRASFVREEDGRLTLIDWAAANLWGGLDSTAQPTRSTAHGLASVYDQMVPHTLQRLETSEMIHKILTGGESDSPSLAELAAAFGDKKGGFWPRWLGG